MWCRSSVMLVLLDPRNSLRGLCVSAVNSPLAAPKGLRKPPIRRQRICRDLRILPHRSPPIPQMRVRQLMRDHPPHELHRPPAQRPFQRHRPPRPPLRRHPHRHVRHSPLPRIIIMQDKRRIPHQIIPNQLRQRGHHFRHVGTQPPIQFKRIQPIVDSLPHGDIVWEGGAGVSPVCLFSALPHPPVIRRRPRIGLMLLQDTDIAPQHRPIEIGHIPTG